MNKSNQRSTLLPLVDQQSEELEGVEIVQIDTMLDSLRHAEFEITSGLGELVDNPVEAGARNIWLITTKKEAKHSKKVEILDTIAIVDDGIGMGVDCLQQCLRMGYHERDSRLTQAARIGKFGVGMTLGGTSLAKKIEVYSRDTANSQFYYTYLDLQAVAEQKQTKIPRPITKVPPEQYAQLLGNSTGTIVILSNCDRLQYDPVNAKAIPATEQLARLSHFLGRTYRKFIASGLNLKLDGEQIYLHDPLFLLGPTRFDIASPKHPDPKAIQWASKRINLEIPESGGKEAAIDITLSLLPKEWRLREGAGDSRSAIDRKIPENEGISILRADREVLYGIVPYITGKKGQARTEKIDRWWGCEISFPPELDPYFQVRFIKRGAEPISSLREKIREEIWSSVRSLRERISSEMEHPEKSRNQREDAIRDVVDLMGKADKTAPHGKRGATKSPKQVEKELDDLADEGAQATGRPREEIRQELEKQPYSIQPVRWPESVFFEPIFHLDRIVVQLNINHPFYKAFFEPLCGSVETLDEDSDPDEGANTPEKRLARRLFFLPLLAYAKAESTFDDPAQVDLIKSLREEWALALARAGREAAKEK